MSILDRTAVLAFALSLASAGIATGALADSRIFSAKASQPGISVEQAFLGDQELPVVGRGDNSTLFRIDSPAAPVPCANQLLFVTSDGERVDLAADLCALNWDVTLQVKDAAAPAPAPAEAPAAPTPAPAETVIEKIPDPVAKNPDGPSFTQSVTISTDDSGTSITEVFFEGKPSAITGREGNGVKTDVTGDEKGIVCQRDLGLVLSDGRRIARSINICLNDWQVLVSLAGEPEPEPVPPSAPSAPVAEVPPATAPLPPVGAAAIDLRAVWAFSSAADRATLVHGVPQTDSSHFVASCVKASGRIKVTLPESASGTSPGSAVTVAFALGPFKKTYPGIASPVDQVSGESHPDVEVPVADPLWPAMIHEQAMGVTVGSQAPLVMTLKGSAIPTRQFLATCSGAPIAPVAVPGKPPAPVGPVPGGIQVTYFCIDGSSLHVVYDGRRRTALVSEPASAPILLQWDGGDRYVAGPSRLTSRGGEVRFSRFGEPARVCQPS